MNNDAAIRVLRAAKQNLLDYGWIQEEFGDTDKGFCLLGALEQAAIPASPDNRAALRAIKAVTGAHGVISWNDDSSRTQEQVMSAIDKAIILLENQS